MGIGCYEMMSNEQRDMDQRRPRMCALYTGRVSARYRSRFPAQPSHHTVLLQYLRMSFHYIKYSYIHLDTTSTGHQTRTTLSPIVHVLFTERRTMVGDLCHWRDPRWQCLQVNKVTKGGKGDHQRTHLRTGCEKRSQTRLTVGLIACYHYLPVHGYFVCQWSEFEARWRTSSHGKHPLLYRLLVFLCG